MLSKGFIVWGLWVRVVAPGSIRQQCHPITLFFFFQKTQVNEWIIKYFSNYLAMGTVRELMLHNKAKCTLLADLKTVRRYRKGAAVQEPQYRTFCIHYCCPKRAGVRVEFLLQCQTKGRPPFRIVTHSWMVVMEWIKLKVPPRANFLSNFEMIYLTVMPQVFQPVALG